MQANYQQIVHAWGAVISVGKALEIGRFVNHRLAELDREEKVSATASDE
jgi:hypothetical protein